MTGATRDCSYRGVWLRSAGAERSAQLLRHPANKPTTPAAASTPAVPVVAEQVKSSDVPIYLGGIGTVQAYPQTMASTVASPLELQFGQIPGVAQMTSSSTLGETVGNLQFAMSRRIDGAAADVLAAINAANG